MVAYFVKDEVVVSKTHIDDLLSGFMTKYQLEIMY